MRFLYRSCGQSAAKVAAAAIVVCADCSNQGHAGVQLAPAVKARPFTDTWNDEASKAQRILRNAEVPELRFVGPSR
jgi:hypothetical protein